MSRPLALERMSVYAKDFQVLIRQHFNQILRMRRSIPPREAPRHNLLVHLQPETLEVHGSSDGRTIVKFAYDALAPCSVRLYWGVSLAACNRLMPQNSQEDSGARWLRLAQGQHQEDRSIVSGSLLELESSVGSSRSPERDSSDTSEAEEPQGLFGAEDCAEISASQSVAAGIGQAYHSAESLGVDFSAWPEVGDDGRIALAIVMSTSKRSASPAAHSQVSFVRCRAARRPEVLQQLALGQGFAHQVQGIFGFEDEAGDADCMVCYDRLRSVITLPCRHCSVCAACLRSLRDERCPLCRSSFSAYLLLPLLRGDPEDV
eukprot:TRINITY_DN78356_c0_g1_i1.p1 TRINITY_DN78356_c0_g1~~TRINITY_DN78356_c0_g1_i1.p1  ORF type:complete len:372 (+),score=59.93 TRINITY_DN78356_c0_g1_i1:164-1117(+)